MTSTVIDNLKVGSCYLNEFFDTESKIRLPEYQRPYSWNKEQLYQLMSDLNEHFFEKGKFIDQLPYYLGTILLYENENGNFEIIDGQQRITTLLILDHAYADNSYLLEANWELSYSSLLSTARIKDNYEHLQSELSSEFANVTGRLRDIYSKVVISVIITNNEDEAFTFFDSQNSRGVSLSPVDFLKSYHLRELKDDIALQEVFAKKWDSNNRNQFLNYLFDQVLWRNRNWKGKQLDFGSKEAILDTFQKKTLRDVTDNSRIELYPNAFNALSTHLQFDSSSGVMVSPKRLNLQTRPEEYPFAIRQPIQKGIGFFLYTEKYHRIYFALFEESERFPEFRNFYKELYTGVSNYLRDFFELATISYYDKFRSEKILEFGLWLDYLLGSYRINQHSIVAQTIIKILRDNSQNLLDVIEMSYRPEEVFTFLRSITNKNNYGQEINGGVRARYRRNNLTYFNDVRDGSKDLKDKKKWIYAITTR